MLKSVITSLSAACLLSLSLGLTACSPASDATAHPGHTPHMASFDIKRCINMGNALEAEYEGAWGYTIEADHFRIIKEAGFDTVRLPIRWQAYTSDKAPYKIENKFMNRVMAVVAQAQSQGLGVIIDVHHYQDFMKDIDGLMPKYLAMWDQIAYTFHDAPSNVYFEPLNEPEKPMTNAQASMVYAKVLPVIRKHNPTRVVIMGGDDWNYVDTMKKITWPNDPYVVATFHDYGPFEFTHQGASWLSHPPKKGRRWGGAKDRKDLVDVYAEARKFQQSSGKPVFVGEMGVLKDVPIRERTIWLKNRRLHAEQAGMSWCAWDFAGAFALYDRDREDWYPGVLDALMR